MARVNVSEIHQKLLDWAHEQVRDAAEHAPEGGRDYRSLLKSKVGFLAAAFIGALSAIWYFILGTERTVAVNMMHQNVDPEEAWEKESSALQTVFDGLTGIVDSSSILTRAESAMIAAIRQYGQELSHLDGVPSDAQKLLADRLRSTEVFLKEKGEDAAQQVKDLGDLFSALHSNPTQAIATLKNLKWSKNTI